MKRIYYVLFVTLLCLVVFTGLSSYYTQKVILEDLPSYQRALKRLGIDWKISAYQRGFLNSSANWRLSIKDLPVYSGELAIGHMPFVSAGNHWGRIHIQGQTLNDETLDSDIVLQFNGKINGKANIAPFSTTVGNIYAIELSIDSDIFKRNQFDIKAKSQGGQYQAQRLPPFELAWHSHWQAQSSAEHSNTNNPLLDWIINNETKHHFVFQLISDDEHKFLRISGNLHEHINTVAQIVMLQYRRMLLTALNNSEWTITLANNSPYKSTIEHTLSRPPYSLPMAFTAVGKRIVGHWQIIEGKLMTP